MFKQHQSELPEAIAGRTAVLDCLEEATIAVLIAKRTPDSDVRYQRIEAIKLVNSITNGGLALSKDYVNSLVIKIETRGMAYLAFGGAL